ncbi:MAG: hypothetical protein JNL74_09695 [Fibrobacteres bacterium]|nr:hypothetical protein [Fibrobacterota bacterium]
MNSIELSQKEIEVINSWYEYSRDDSQHYGDGLATFPQEQVVSDKLNNGNPVKEFSDYEITLIHGWMEESVSRGYGGNTVLIGEERSLFAKFSSIMKSLDERNKTFTETIPKSETKIQTPAKTVTKQAPPKQEESKATSPDDKIAAAQKLRNEMEEIKKTYKWFKR